MFWYSLLRLRSELGVNGLSRSSGVLLRTGCQGVVSEIEVFQVCFAWTGSGPFPFRSLDAHRSRRLLRHLQEKLHLPVTCHISYA